MRREGFQQSHVDTYFESKHASEHTKDMGAVVDRRRNQCVRGYTDGAAPRGVSPRAEMVYSHRSRSAYEIGIMPAPSASFGPGPGCSANMHHTRFGVSVGLESNITTCRSPT